jgi:hypothetical protein
MRAFGNVDGSVMAMMFLVTLAVIGFELFDIVSYHIN